MSEIRTIAGMDNAELQESILATCKRHIPNINLPSKFNCILDGLPLIYGEGMVKGYEFAESKIAKLEQQLSTEREAREKAEDEVRLLKIDTVLLRGRAESAEQRIKEAQEQEPVMEYRSENAYHSELIWHKQVQNGTKLYAAPIPSADVQEVMDELLETNDKLEELQREMNIVKAHEAAERAYDRISDELSNTQATAEAYDREHAAKVLEFLMQRYPPLREFQPSEVLKYEIGIRRTQSAQKRKGE